MPQISINTQKFYSFPLMSKKLLLLLLLIKIRSQDKLL